MNFLGLGQICSLEKLLGSSMHAIEIASKLAWAVLQDRALNKQVLVQTDLVISVKERVKWACHTPPLGRPTNCFSFQPWPLLSFSSDNLSTQLA